MKFSFRTKSIPELTSGFCILLLLVGLIEGCTPTVTPVDDEIIPPPSFSLLTATPLPPGGEETTALPLQPDRYEMNNARVYGWKVPYDPPEVGFEVELRENPFLTFRLGAKTRVSIRIGDLVMRIEYIPEILPSDFVQDDTENPVEPGVPITIWETTPVNTPDAFSEWHHVDLSLRRFAPGKGEIRFVNDGPLAGNPGVDIIYGEPTIYYPDEMSGKNILLIGVDTLRRDALSPYGADPRITPNLSVMASEGVIFEQARSQAPWTLPSFASMVTGRLPSEIGSMIYTGFLPQRNDTISEVLFDKGYATATVCSNSWLGNDQSGFEQGVEEMWFKSDAQAQESVDVARDFIARSSGRDWFCFLHFMDPHVPYAPLQEFYDLLVDPQYDGDIGNVFGAIEGWKSGESRPDEGDLRRVVGLYHGEVAGVDKALGGLFEFLNENGMMDNTLVILAADHGEEFFDHGGFEHGHTHFDELEHLPLIIKGGEFTGGKSVSDSVGNTDIFPTILKFLGEPLPDNLAGIPLQDVLAGEVENSRFIYGEDNSRGTHRKYVVQWPYKCILDFVTGEIRLYNLETDPGERTNVYEDKKEIAEALAKAIAMRMRPEESAFQIWISRSYHEPQSLFEGTITIPGGFKSVDSFKLVEGDTYAVQGDTVMFSIMSSLEPLGPNKHIVIVPNDITAELEMDLKVDGRVLADRFYPYGTRDAEQSGHATVSLDDFGAGPNLPLAIQEYPAACYIWGIKGISEENESIELDQETIDELRAIGYFTE